MSKARLTARRISVAIGLATGMAAGSAAAVGLSSVSVSGNNIAYFVLNPSNCSTVKTSPAPANLDPIVQGSSAQCIANINPGPGGNIELGDNDLLIPAQPAQTLTGTLPSGQLTVSSLLLADWNAPFGSAGLTLAAKYLADAIFVGCGITVDTADPGFAALVTAFTANPGPWIRLSDPNVSYANEDNGIVTLGLAGLLNAKTLVPLTCPDPIPTPDVIQASEVAKVTGESSTSYLYSFAATDSGITSDDATESHTGNYEISLPYDPPSATKVGTLQGNAIQWVATWVNPNPWSVLLEGVDPIPAGTEYTTTPDPVTCEGSITSSNLPVCEYNAGGNQIEFSALVPPNGQVVVTFYTNITDSGRSVFRNTADACWDSDGNGEIDQSLDSCESTPPARVITGGGPGPVPVPVPEPVPVPVMSAAGQFVCMVGLGVIGVRFLRRRLPEKKTTRRRAVSK